MYLAPAPLAHGMAGIAGHVGVGHAYSHSGFMQDDSTGFSVLLFLLCRVHAMDVTIADVQCPDGKTICVTTRGGGTGQAAARRGVSPFELGIMRQAIGRGRESLQHLVCRLFGRMYGQGVYDVATAFELAVAVAQLDTVRQCWPHETVYDRDDTPESCGVFLGGNLALDGQPVAWLLSINASQGGIGPNEDSEGIIPIGNKGRLMQRLGMDRHPVIVLEAKSFVPSMKDTVHAASFFVRWNETFDNAVVGRSLALAAEKQAMPCIVQGNAYQRDDQLSRETRNVGCEIAEIGERYAHAETAAQKVSLAGRLSVIVSERLGGSIFLSDAIFRIVGGGGLWPGQAAVLSLLATEAYACRMCTMVTENEELEGMVNVTLDGMGILLANIDEAHAVMRARKEALSPEALLKMASPE